MDLVKRLLPTFPAFCALMAALHAQPLEMNSLVVTADRTSEPASQVPFSVASLDSEALRSSPSLTLDDALRTIPDFSLFRRDGSLMANPTTQGVSLRGLGPSGASRSLVLLDGIPLNDPFGGWISWSQVPRESLAGAEIVSGGGATAWGGAALGGVVQLLTEAATGSRERLAASLGDFDTRSAELEATQPVGPGTLQILAAAFATDGYLLISPSTRGPVDIAASSQHSWLTARWRHPICTGVEAILTAHTFEEHRGNGTPYQQNRTRENLLALTLSGNSGGSFSWTAAGYSQDEDFASTYSSVNLPRTAETPAENQFAVPSDAVGANWTGTWRGADGVLTNIGADLREVRGETREDYSYSNGAYSDRRLAGGRQGFAGLYGLREQPIGSSVRLSLGVRLDEWEESGGHLRQSLLATGASLGDSEYPSRRGTEGSPSAGIKWQASKALRFRANAQQSFRVPTLNELYRPFRQGNNITEANPNLQTEHAASAELGADGIIGELRAGVAGFASVLHNAVDAVTIATGPANVPGIGVIPAGGMGLERLNLDRVRVAGFRTYAEWQVSGSLRLRADALLENTGILRASANPALVGNRLVQVPDYNVSVGARWAAPGGLEVTPRLRWFGSQFSDDQNRLRLPAAIVADLNVARKVGAQARLFVTIENLGNARVETDLSATGVVNVGAPRIVFFGIRLER